MEASARYRLDLEQLVSDWDACQIRGVWVHGIFEREYLELLSSASEQPLIQVPEHLIRGDNRITPADVVLGDAVPKIRTYDGETLGPYKIRGIRRTAGGMVSLTLEAQP